MTASPSAQQIRAAIRSALDEDLSLGDVTTVSLFPKPLRARGTILTHQSMVVAGLAVARQVFAELDGSLRIFTHVQDGQRASDGSPVLTVEGDASAILMGERVALNFLQHLSGVATLTATFCEITRPFGAKILDTRKTLPGLRALEKWAVRLGGGTNHRHSLGDGVLIKDNHLALLRAHQVDIAGACRRARERAPHGHRIMIEVETLKQVREAVNAGADVILLDNMDVDSARKAVDTVKGRALVEASGGITLENAAGMAAAGVHALSIGALTHSAPAVNLSMEMVPLGLSSRQRRKTRR